jgi:hypothetical protein
MRVAAVMSGASLDGIDQLRPIEALRLLAELQRELS